MIRAFVLPPPERLPGEFQVASGSGPSYRSQAISPGEHDLAEDQRIWGSIRGVRLDRRAVDALAELPALDALTLADVTFDDDAAAGLGALAALMRLDLQRAPLSRPLVAALARLPALTRLALRGIAVDDAAARSLAAVAGLTSLSLVGDGVPLTLTDEGLTALGDLELTSLAIALAPAITGAGLVRFGDAARLSALEVTICGELGEAAVIDHVSRLAQLLYLDLSFDARLGDRALAGLAPLQALEGLMLRGLGRVSAGGILSLSALSALKSLHISTARKMKRFKSSDLEELLRLRPGLTISRT